MVSNVYKLILFSQNNGQYHEFELYIYEETRDIKFVGQPTFVECIIERYSINLKSET